VIEKRFQHIILDSIQELKDSNSTILLLDKPHLRYLTKQQADSWLEIGKASNTHTSSDELKLIKNNLPVIFPDKYSKITVADWGCGDGKKSRV
jgi:hypothetical protein